MKKIFSCVAITLIFVTSAAFAQSESQEDVILLDLSKSTTPLSFNEVNGMWEGTYDDDEEEINSQVFTFGKGSMGDYNTWWGFTASNSVNNSFQSNTVLYQFSNMAKGGILLNEDGSIQKNSFGAPVSGNSMPYIVSFCMAGFPPAEITFNTEKSYEVIGAYVNLNSYTFYSILYGDGFSRAFTEGDDLTLIVKGIDAENNEKTLKISLASFNNGCITASTGWKYIDLSSIGLVEELQFSMEGTDSGAYGLNTPAYFCLDKLAVKEASGSALVDKTSMAKKNNLHYDRTNKNIMLDNPDFIMIYDSLGHVVMSSSDTKTISMKDLPSGIYVAKTGNNRLKFWK